jgi:penicillin amidase
MLGEDLSEWEWGTLHTITFRNQTFGESGIGLLERVFNRGPFPVPSGLDQVFSADVDLSNPFEVVNHASMRQVIDLAELTDSLFTHTTGQSGHPFHSHYDDMIDDWLNVRFHEHHWTRPELLRSSPDILRLMPGR